MAFESEHPSVYRARSSILGTIRQYTVTRHIVENKSGRAHLTTSCSPTMSGDQWPVRTAHNYLPVCHHVSHQCVGSLL